MPARVMLLILATALFIAIWSGDQGDPAAKSAARPEDAAPADGQSNEPEGMSTREPFGDEPLAVEFTRAGCPEPLQPAFARRPGSTLAASPLLPADVPLPCDLTPGEYQVVSNRGDSFRMTFSAEELEDRGIPHTVPGRNLYVLADGGMRWHFIRIEEPALEVVSVEPRRIERPPAEDCDARSALNWGIVRGGATGSMGKAARHLRAMSLQAASFGMWLHEACDAGWRRSLNRTAELSIDAFHGAWKRWSTWPRRLSRRNGSEQLR